MVKEVTSIPGFFGNYLPIVNGKRIVCRHFHRTANGAMKCGKEIARFLKKVELLKKERIESCISKSN